MFTIFDYIKYYGNKSIKELKWNDADSMICAILNYLPIKEYTGKKSIDELYEHLMNNAKASDKKAALYLKDESVKVLKALIGCERYSGLDVYNFVNYKNNDTQFGAATFRIGNMTIVSFKGTDSSLIGWIEDIRLMYQYPVNTQVLALDYFKKNVRFFGDNNLCVVGHSKGGNLAMYSSMECNSFLFGKIKRIVNFDGPGFLYEQYKSSKFLKMSTKLVNYVPEESIVGMCLDNDNYNIVKSKNIVWNEHYVTNWMMFGEYFIEGSLSKVSAGIHNSTTVKLRDIDREQVGKAFETIFKSLYKDYSRDLKINLNNLISAYENLKGVDPKVKKEVGSIIKTLFKRL